MSQSILYYPTINILDGNWLRNAVLYWDEVCSIVPDRYDAHLSKELLYLQERGIYRPLHPTELFYSSKGATFSNTVLHRLTAHQRRRQNVTLDQYTPFAEMHIRKFQDAFLSDLIHYRKIPTDLTNYLIENHLITVYDNDWLEMGRNVADIYMSTLAEYLAKVSEQDMVIGTDRNKNLYSVYNRCWHAPGTFCLSAVFEQAMPQPSLEVGFEQLVDFRLDHQQELLQLRGRLRELEAALSRNETLEELKAHLQTFRGAWERELKKTEHAMRSSHISYFLGNTMMLIEVTGGAAGLMTAIAQQYGGKVPNWLFGTGVAMAGMVGLGTSFVNHHKKLKETRESRGFSYLYDAYHEGILHNSGGLELI